ncbi:caspase family protein [Mitsuaria sp. WAJ17]|uniref:caspase family protein n=1 Tax=Mitsuaria sp. WAJ17 TaxID=2761452 RepID=UPI0015FF8050|nr:caspase family protein [Mitsuaria sp. WAJ17]MBB2484479.1 caspase family protein [Mitsuaria sp. WAJ17]
MRRRALMALSTVPLLSLAGCVAPQQVRGYERVYQAHQLSDQQLAQLQARLRAEGLAEARVARDTVGRAQLLGRYASEEQVETAFVLAQALLGPTAVSPFYPTDIAERRWEREAALALQAHAQARQRQAPPSRRRALLIGINQFLDDRHLRPLQGEDDARRVQQYLARAGYETTALLGPEATRGAIESAIAAVGRALGSDDELFIYVSSHGALPLPGPAGGDDRRMSIVAYDSGDAMGPRSRDAAEYLLRLQRSSVRDSLLQDLAQRPSRQTRALIDTCYSGEMLQSLRQEPLPAGLAEQREGIALQPWAATARAQRSRYTLLTATSPGELALGPPPREGSFESPLRSGRRLRGSFFTQLLFECLEQRQGLLQEAFADAERLTAQLARQVSAGRLTQTPRLLSTMARGQDRL